MNLLQGELIHGSLCKQSCLIYDLQKIRIIGALRSHSLSRD